MAGKRRAERRREARTAANEPRSEYQRAIDPSRNALLQLTDFASERRLLTPATGSPAAADRAVAASWTGVLEGTGDNVAQFANLSLIAAEESLRSIAIIHGDRRAFVIADKVLARSVLEACGRARYLLDLAVEPAVRVNRALSERLHGIDEHAKVANLIPLPRDPSDALAELVSAAEAAGLVVPPNAKPPFVGAKRPGSNEALALGLSLLEDRSVSSVTVRFLAWFVHTTPGGILTLHDHGSERVSDDGQVSVPLMASADNVNLWIGFLGTAFSQVQQAYLDYFGRSDPQWDEARRAFSVVALRR